MIVDISALPDILRMRAFMELLLTGYLRERDLQGRDFSIWLIDPKGK